MSAINKIYHNPIFARTVKTVVYVLQKELADCESVLDIGCGPDSPIQHCKNIKSSVGVEPFEEYIDKSKNRQIHNEYIHGIIKDLDFEANSFDAVVMIEVLEHMTEEEGREALHMCEKWARKKVIVTTPNGFIEQQAIDGNDLQRHLSGWTVGMFSSLGYKVRGLAGFKFLRSEKDEDTMDDNIMVSIRFRPKLFWFVVATVSQIFTYFVPRIAFELVAVKVAEESYGFES